MAKSADSDESVVDLLLSQHKQIKKLFEDVLNASGREKRDLFYDLVRLLAIHESAEEQVVHPTARRSITHGDSIVEARLTEEGEAKRALSELYDIGVDHPDFDMRLRDLSNSVVEHANTEETQEFDQLRQSMSEQDLIRMAGAVRAAEAVAPTRPHPAAGESATANTLVGPPLAVFDRIRDAVRSWSGS